ncbi:MAG: DUF4416 family protein [Deltaproteobacteria bacterium]|nr:DUF4416 family protein [Deltaproteobacteria bacterium]
MGIPREPKPVKLFVGLLSGHAEIFSLAEKELAALFGPVDSASASLPWAVTDYYKEEMGAGLLRKFVSFAPLVSPEELAQTKLKTQGLEAGYHWIDGEKRGRRINIDPGYLDVGKIVLASTKCASHRIYLRSGIYGEVTLLFQDGSFQPLAYTYADYLWPEALSFFMGLRALYLTQLKQAL